MQTPEEMIKTFEFHIIYGFREHHVPHIIGSPSGPRHGLQDFGGWKIFFIVNLIPAHAFLLDFRLLNII